MTSGTLLPVSATLLNAYGQSGAGAQKPMRIAQQEDGIAQGLAEAENGALPPASIISVLDAHNRCFQLFPLTVK
jgi:hypothetical protein